MSGRPASAVALSQGYRAGKHLALGYVKAGTLSLGEGCNLRVFARNVAAVRHSPHVYDPENLRMES